ncbi:hypothetical protein OTU49_006535, partial [Cherax quadricarinatus]
SIFPTFIDNFYLQVLTSTELMDYHTLNYFSLASVTIAFIIACCLDPVSSSIYFHRQQYLPTSEEDSSVILSDHHIQETIKEKISKVAGFIWNDFKSAYSNKYLLKWSIWWAFATCGNFQVGNYIQPLWESIAPMDENENLYNGAVEASQTLLSALAAFGVGYLHLNWEYFGEGTLAIISLIDGLLLFFMGLTSSIAVGYINYIVFRVSYQVLITVASSSFMVSTTWSLLSSSSYCQHMLVESWGVMGCEKLMCGKNNQNVQTKNHLLERQKHSKSATCPHLNC